MNAKAYCVEHCNAGGGAAASHGVASRTAILVVLPLASAYVASGSSRGKQCIATRQVGSSDFAAGIRHLAMTKESLLDADGR